MRSSLLISAIFLASTSMAGTEGSVVTTTIQWGAPHALDVTYVEKMPKEQHTVAVLIRQVGTQTTRSQKVTVRGTLSKDQVTAILNSIYSNDAAYWDKRFWEKRYWNKVELTGDSHLARVTTSVGAEYAYGGITYWVSSDKGEVLLLYTSDSRFF